MWDILTGKQKIYKFFKKIKLNSNLNGPPGFFLLSKAANLSRADRISRCWGFQVLFTRDIMFTVLLFPAS